MRERQKLTLSSSVSILKTALIDTAFGPCPRTLTFCESRSSCFLMMSALGDEESRVTGFDRGADDYLPKPFSSRELEVRVNAILRRISYERGQGVAQPAVDDAELHFDEKASRLRYGDIAVIFTPTEYRLLEVLHAHAGEVQSKAFLYQQVLHRGFTRHDRVLDMHVSNLRRKLSQAGIDCLRLESVWGHGYLLSRDPC